MGQLTMYFVLYTFLLYVSDHLAQFGGFLFVERSIYMVVQVPFLLPIDNSTKCFVGWLESCRAYNQIPSKAMF